MRTSDLQNAGTHAKVYMTVYGLKPGASVMASEREPLGSGGKSCTDFEQGQLGEFEVKYYGFYSYMCLRMVNDVIFFCKKNCTYIFNIRFFF